MSDDTKRARAEEPATDAWLRAALRHAPDADAAPPAVLRENILATARAAARTPPLPLLSPRTASGPHGARWLDRVAAFWAWLARPPVAAGFAGVMAATLVGVMWWDRPLDEAMPPSPSTAAAPARAVEPPTTSTPPVAAPTLPMPTPMPMPTPASPTAPEPATRDAALRKQRAIEPTATPKAAAKPLPPPAGANDAERSSVAESFVPAKNERAEARTAMASTAPAAPTPSPAPAGAGLATDALRDATPTTQPTTQPALAATEGKVVASPSAAAAVSPRAPAPFPSAAPRESQASDKRAFDRSGPPPAAAKSERARPATPLSLAPAPATALPVPTRNASPSPAVPMASLMAALDDAGSNWTSRGASGSNVALDAATRAWLTSVEAAGAGAWRGVTDRRIAGDGPAHPAGTPFAQLLRNGSLAATIRIADDRVVFEAADGTASQAPLAPADVARLRATLPLALR